MIPMLSLNSRHCGIVWQNGVTEPNWRTHDRHPIIAVCAAPLADDVEDASAELDGVAGVADADQELDVGTLDDVELLTISILTRLVNSLRREAEAGS